MVTRWRSALLGAGFFLSACTVGDITDPAPDLGPGQDPGQRDPDPNPDPDPEPDPDYSLLLAPAAQELTLGTATEFTLTLSSSHFDGEVSLSASGMPESWLVSFDPETVLLTDGETALATMRVDVPTSGEATTAAFAVEASAEIGTRDAVAEVTVENLLLVAIDIGTAENQHPFAAPSEVRLGAAIRFVNYDAQRHRIHSDHGAAGFPHEPSPGMDPSTGEELPGGAYQIEINQPGDFDYYCHEHGRGAGVGLFRVLAP